MDPVTAKGLFTIGSTLLGGLFGSSGQKSANRANLQIARENRAFQERMSSTAYQRSAKDLQAAGLNRILALGSPATSPGGAVATMGNVGAAGVEGASKAGMLAATIELTKAQTAKTKAEEDAIRKTADIRSPGAAVGSVLGNAIEKIKGAIGDFRGNVEPKLVQGANTTAKTFAYGVKKAASGKKSWTDNSTWQQKLEKWYENEKKRGRQPTYDETRSKGIQYLQNEIGLQERKR